MRERLTCLTLAAACGLLLLAPARPAHAAEIDFGLRAGIYSDADGGFVGAEALTSIGRRWFFNPNAELVFVDDGSLWSLNADAHYDLPTSANLAVWVGGGPALIFREVDRPRGCPRCEEIDETDVGLNLLAGIGTKRGAMRPYAQAKVVLSDDTEAVLGVGLRFH
jgi:hypothetical protein